MQRAEENFKDTTINSFREKEMTAKMTNPIGGLENKVQERTGCSTIKTMSLALKEQR